MLKARLRRLEAAVVPGPSAIEKWFTLDGAPVAPPGDVVDQVEAVARDLREPKRWRGAVWLPDRALACLLGEGENELQLVELG
ncbi:MAG: hypothetical protein WBD55_06275 [Dehalococcoidia bacterium]